MLESKDKEGLNSYQNTQLNTDKDNKIKVVETKTPEKNDLSITPYQSFGMMNEIINNNILFIDKSK